MRTTKVKLIDIPADKKQFPDNLEYEHLDEISHGFPVLLGAKLALFVKLHIPDLCGYMLRTNLSVQFVGGIVCTFRPSQNI